jgi:hypothetical protein
MLNSPIPVVLERCTMAEWWRHNLRWQVIIRHYVPRLYAIAPLLGWGVFCALLHLLLSVATRHNVTFAAALLCAVILAKIVSQLVVSALFSHEKSTARYVWFAPINELLGALLWMCAYLTNEIVWRGIRFRLHATATAEQVLENDSVEA